MAFLSGPRQSGKSALAKMALPNARYSSYDAPKDVQGTDPDGTEIPEGFRLIFEITMGWDAIVSPR